MVLRQQRRPVERDLDLDRHRVPAGELVAHELAHGLEDHVVFALGRRRRKAGWFGLGLIDFLSQFQNVKRRLELRGEVGGVRVYDDFAHHPTAIASTLAGLRQHVGKQRILAVLEPRSNTMRLGIFADALGQALAPADAVYFYQPPL